jgi:histidyl-tRNA synthetase
VAVILGESELGDGVAVIRDLDRGEQETVGLGDVVARVAGLLQPKR